MELLFRIGCLTSQQHASASQGWVCSDNGKYCHTETEVADDTCYLSLSQYGDTESTISSADLIMLGIRQGSHWSSLA